MPVGIDDCPRVLSPLCSERIYLSSDVGRTSGELAKEFDHDFSELEGLWWYNEGSQDAKHIAEEPMGEMASCASLLCWGQRMGMQQPALRLCFTALLMAIFLGEEEMTALMMARVQAACLTLAVSFPEGFTTPKSARII